MNRIVPNGTGFFVLTQKDDKSISHGYLVTAKHVLKPEPLKPDFFNEVYIRLSKKEGGVQLIPLRTVPEGENKNVYFHNDPTVDIAVIPAFPKPESYEFKTLPSDFILTDENFEKYNIKEGSDIFFAGMFMPYLGDDKNYPIIRFGRIALLSDEKIKFMNEQRSLYLVDTFSFGGNSGSPVFIYLGADRKPGSIVIGSPVLKLIGVMSGTFRNPSLTQEVSAESKRISFDNMGIAAVAPSKLLHEIIFSDELKEARGY